MNDLTGKVFSRLTVLRENGRTKDRHILWLCRCECGNTVNVSSRDLRSGHTKSCGCLCRDQVSAARKKHGASGNHTNIERLYKVWISMRKRCNNPKDKSYKYYGALGVRVCEEWNSYQAFKVWALNNGYDENAPHGECTIDRINPFDDYTPNNCRWVNMMVQSHNKRARMDGEQNG